MDLASQKFFNATDGCWYEISNSREWHEEDHPRASDGKFISSFSDIRNLTGTIDPSGEHFETKYRTAEHHLTDKAQHLAKEIESGRYDKLPSTKKSMQALLDIMHKELSELHSLRGNNHNDFI